MPCGVFSLRFFLSITLGFGVNRHGASSGFKGDILVD